MEIALINMPFARWRSPSLALAQLSQRVTQRFGSRVEVRVLDLNHVFAQEFGCEAYDYFGDEYIHGLGEWLFRQAAFPEQDDNTDRYLGRYYPGNNPDRTRIRALILDCRARIPELLERCLDEHRLAECDVVGFTSVFSQNTACFALARLTKWRNPGVTTVMGGANCETPMGEVIVHNVPAIDYVFSGPGLISFPELVERLLDGQRPAHLQIDGVMTRPAGAAIVATTAGASQAEDRQLPLLRPSPADAGRSSLGRDLPMHVPIPLDYGPFVRSYRARFPSRHGEIELPFETSRGCWWGERSHCTFCGLNGSTMGYRAMAPTEAIAQFESLLRYYPDCREFMAVDNILPRDYAGEVFGRLSVPDDLNIYYEVKSDLSDDELRLMNSGGVRRMQSGVESLNTSTLKLMRKGTSAFQNLRFLLACKQHGISLLWNLLVGFPGEPDAVFEKYVRDVPSLLHLAPPTGVYPIRFDRFSPYFMHPDEYGLRLVPLDFYRLVYPFAEDEFARFAYYFNDVAYGPYFEAVASWLDRMKASVGRWQGRWSDSRPSFHQATSPFPADAEGHRAFPEGVAGPPRLVLAENGVSTAVLDSREGPEAATELSQIEVALLTACRRPQQVRRLPEQVPDTPAAAVARALTRLRELRLVFEENERVMSLVEVTAGSGEA